MSERMTDKIKPCPFCGKEPRIIVDEGPDVGFDEYLIDCDCISGIEVYGHEVDGDTEESTIAKWNTRPIEDRLRAQRDRLRKALVRLANGLVEEEYRRFTYPDSKWRIRSAALKYALSLAEAEEAVEEK